MKVTRQRFLLFAILIFFIGIGIYTIPAIKTRINYQLDTWRAEIKYAISPPEAEVFIPQQQTQLATVTTTTLSSPAPAIATAEIPVGDDVPSETPAPTPEVHPTATHPPLPEKLNLTGFVHEYQSWNNCGPATLAMALSFWDWNGNQDIAATFLKPNERDKNVMPYEIVNFVESQTSLFALSRAGGDLPLIKRFLSAGFPIMLEKGFEGGSFDGWMGHYVLLTGYDDNREEFMSQDSYLGPHIPVRYDEITTFWRAFNFTYIVVYPPERVSEVLEILGERFDEETSSRLALDIASNEIYNQSGRDQFFAWFNRGTNLVALQDYSGAAEAYDQAFALYATLDENERPWRIMWYQTGPYWAYYYTGRYYDVLNLATTTIDAVSEPAIEESFYWRALAYEALGDVNSAIDDLKTSLIYHPNFQPGVAQLERLGVQSP
jgi:hypothetical protein